MITKCWPGWYKVNIDYIHASDKSERIQWCKNNIGFTDHDTWVFQPLPSRVSHGNFLFKEEKWALMFVLRWT